MIFKIKWKGLATRLPLARNNLKIKYSILNKTYPNFSKLECVLFMEIQDDYFIRNEKKLIPNETRETGEPSEKDMDEFQIHVHPISPKKEMFTISSDQIKQKTGYFMLPKQIPMKSLLQLHGSGANESMASIHLFKEIKKICPRSIHVSYYKEDTVRYLDSSNRSDLYRKESESQSDHHWIGFELYHSIEKQLFILGISIIFEYYPKEVDAFLDITKWGYWQTPNQINK